jgi:hypothetical protein
MASWFNGRLCFYLVTALGARVRLGHAHKRIFYIEIIKVANFAESGLYLLLLGKQ